MTMEPWRTLYPFTPRRFDRGGGISMSYLDEGAGEAVVMVHGNPTWSFFYRDLAASLRDTRRVIVPDHVGCGLSDVPPESRYSYTLASRVDDLGRLIDSLGLDRVTLVVHDWGGMIGMAWAVRNPARVSRIVLLNTAAFSLPPGRGLPWQIGVVRNTPLGGVLVRRLGLFNHGLVRFCSRRSLPDRVRQGYLAPYRTYSNRLAVLRFVQDIPLGPGDPSWDLVQSTDAGLSQFAATPVLVCWGRHDFVFGDAFLDGWRQRWPHAEYHVFEDAAHLTLEDAGDRIVPLVRYFVGSRLRAERPSTP